MTLAQAEADLTGWYIGWGIAIPLIIVVAALVLLITVTANAIAMVAEDATRALEQSRERTEALWQVKETNRATTDIIGGAAQARKALGG